MNLLQYCFCFTLCFSGREGCGLFTPRPGDRTCTPCIGRQTAHHWTARQVPRNQSLRAFSSECEEKKKKSKNVQNCELAECEERPARKQSFLDTSGDQGATGGERPTMPRVHREPPGALIHGFLAIGVLLLWETMV